MDCQTKHLDSRKLLKTVTGEPIEWESIHDFVVELFWDVPKITNKQITIVTASDTSHFLSVKQLISSINHFERKSKIIFYDLGLREEEKEEIKNMDLIYKNFKFNSITKSASGNETHFTAQMYNKYYSGRLCMLTFKNNAFVSMYTLD